MATALNTIYYVWGGSSIIAEYVLKTGNPLYAKHYFYAGSRLLMTISKGKTVESTEYHHPDRLGTQLVTSADTGGSYRQTTLPFGTSIGAETTGNTNQVFTSYDRSTTTGLDYATNRTYSKGQSRFTQVDPIGMASASLGNPQSNNLYAYVQNMPTDFIDPSGLTSEPPINMGTTWGARWDWSFWLWRMFGNFSDGPLVSVTGGGGGGGSRQSNPCDVTFPLFFSRGKAYTGLIRKTGTAGNHQFGTANTTHFIRELGEEWAKSNSTPIRAGDISLKNGADTPDHKEHEGGYQFDIGLFVVGGENRQGVTYKTNDYDSATTRKLVRELQSNPNVSKIIFNDPGVSGDKIHRDKPGGTTHDNHLHVEWKDGCRR